jgi:raffinose/stachyose/melibiose transport system permease protein
MLATADSWNAYLLPSVVCTTGVQPPLPLTVRNYSTRYLQETALVLAFATLAMTPALVPYLVAERQMVAGPGAGAVEG